MIKRLKRWLLKETDHGTLFGLLKKPLDEMSPRIQRLAMRLLRFQFTLLYIPGKNLQVPDTLSRDLLNSTLNTDYLKTLKVYCLVITSKQKEKYFEIIPRKMHNCEQCAYAQRNGVHRQIRHPKPSCNITFSSQSQYTATKFEAELRHTVYPGRLKGR